MDANPTSVTRQWLGKLDGTPIVGCGELAGPMSQERTSLVAIPPKSVVTKFKRRLRMCLGTWHESYSDED